MLSFIHELRTQVSAGMKNVYKRQQATRKTICNVLNSMASTSVNAHHAEVTPGSANAPMVSTKLHLDGKDDEKDGASSDALWV